MLMNEKEYHQNLFFIYEYFYSSLQLLSRLLIAPGQDLQGFEQRA